MDSEDPKNLLKLTIKQKLKDASSDSLSTSSQVKSSLPSPRYLSPAVPQKLKSIYYNSSLLLADLSALTAVASIRQYPTDENKRRKWLTSRDTAKLADEWEHKLGKIVGPLQEEHKRDMALETPYCLGIRTLAHQTQRRRNVHQRTATWM